MSTSDTTTDHQKIRDWVEARGGHPARVKSTGTGGILRIDFEPSDNDLERISWDEFFETFEKSELAFVRQDQAADGAASRFNKFVSRS